MNKNFINVLISVVALIVSFIIFEGFLIAKNTVIPNYDVEMWKYSRLLKEKDANEMIGHVHKKNTEVELQKTLIRTNELGLRGPSIAESNWLKVDNRVLLLGSSIALGWGVPENKILSSVLQDLAKKDSKSWSVLNAGVGNYNTERYVTNYMQNLRKLDPDTLVVLFFVNDTELLKNNSGNFFTRNFQFAVLIWKYIRAFNENLGLENIQDYYTSKFEPNYDGYKKARSSLARLKNHCDATQKKCLIAMMPDIHNFDPYPLHFVHENIKKLSQNLGLKYLDLYPYFDGIDTKSLWNSYNDPHPNELGHKIIAEAIYKTLK